MALLGGLPLVVRVWQRVQELGVADEVVVATDAEIVAEVVTRAGGRAILTSPHHQSGTERIAEVVGRKEFLRYDVVLNVQGDEPFLLEGAARGALDRVAGGRSRRHGGRAARRRAGLGSGPGQGGGGRAGAGPLFLPGADPVASGS